MARSGSLGLAAIASLALLSLVDTARGMTAVHAGTLLGS